MAPSYFVEIEGVRYDRELIEKANHTATENADKLLSVDDVKDLFKSIFDGSLLSVSEETTLIFIRETYRRSDDAENWFKENVDSWIENRKLRRKRLNRNRQKVKPLTSITAELEDSPRKVPKKRPPIPYQQGYYRTAPKNSGLGFNTTPQKEPKKEESYQEEGYSPISSSRREAKGRGLQIPKGLGTILLLILIATAFFTGKYTSPVQYKDVKSTSITESGGMEESQIEPLEEVERSDDLSEKEQPLMIAKLEQEISGYREKMSLYEDQSARIIELEKAIEESRRETGRLRLSNADKVDSFEEQSARIRKLEAAIEESRHEIDRLRSSPPQAPQTVVASQVPSELETHSNSDELSKQPEGQVVSTGMTVDELPHDEDGVLATAGKTQTEGSTAQEQQLITKPLQSVDRTAISSAEDAAEIVRLESLVSEKDETISLLNLRLFRHLDQEQNRRDAEARKPSIIKKPSAQISKVENEETKSEPSKSEKTGTLAPLPQVSIAESQLEVIEQQKKTITDLEAEIVQKNLQTQELTRQLTTAKSMNAVSEEERSKVKELNAVQEKREKAGQERERLLFHRLDQQQVRVLRLETALSEKSGQVKRLEEQLEQKSKSISSIEPVSVASDEKEQASETGKLLSKAAETSPDERLQKLSEKHQQQNLIQQREIAHLKVELQKSHLTIRSSVEENEKLKESITTLQSTLDAKPSVSIAQPVKVIKEQTELQKKIAETLEKQLEDEFKNKNIQFDKERLLVTFLPEHSFFKIGDVALKQEVKQILSDFFPKLVDTIKSFDEEIVQIQFQGHSSSYWQKATNKTDAYLKNLGLSILRAESALRYCLELEEVEKDRAWLRKRTVTAGFSDNRPVLRADNQEDPIRSRRITIAIGTLND